MANSLSRRQKADQRVKNTCAETLIPCLDGPGAPHASLPTSCALGRQRVQRRRLHWHCFQAAGAAAAAAPPPAAPACCARRATKRAFVGQKKAKKVDLKIVLQKITQLISRHLVRKTGYEAGTGIPRLLSKDNNTGFSRHIKTGCNLPVCITNVY